MYLETFQTFYSFVLCKQSKVLAQNFRLISSKNILVLVKLKSITSVLLLIADKSLCSENGRYKIATPGNFSYFKSEAKMHTETEKADV